MSETFYHSVWFFATKRELPYLATALPLVKKNLKADIAGYHIVGPREDKLQRAAYDMGCKFNILNGEFSWIGLWKLMEAEEASDRFVIWFPHCLPLHVWNPGKGEEVRFFGDGYGVAFPRILGPELIGNLTGPVQPETLAALTDRGEVHHPHIRELTAGQLRSWDQNLGLGGAVFNDAVVFRDERLSF